MNRIAYSICSDGKCLVNVNQPDEPLTNFHAEPVEVFCDIQGRPAILRVNVSLLGQCHIVDLQLSMPSLVKQIEDAVPGTRILKRGARKSIDAYLLEIGLSANGGQCAPSLYFDHHGLFRLDTGQWVYVAGDEVLGLSEDIHYTIAPHTAGQRLSWDPNLDDRTSVRKLCEILEDNHGVLYPVLAFHIASALRSQINRLGLTTFPVLAIVGGHNLGKTTLCETFLLPYDDKANPGHVYGMFDAVSTPSAARAILSEHPDQVVVMDDLAHSSSQAQQSKRADLVAECLRFAANDSVRGRVAGNGTVEMQSCAAGMAFTGETHLTSPSDINRTITVELKQPMENWDSCHRTIAASVFRKLLLYLLPRLDEELLRLEEALGEIAEGKDQRLRKGRMLLMWAMRIFCDFSVDCGALKKKQACILYEDADKKITKLICRQAEQSHRNSVASYILLGMENGVLVVVREKEIERKKKLPKYPYYYKKGGIYIKSDILWSYLANTTPYKFSSTKTMGKKLREEGLIRESNECRTANARSSGKRYLCMDMRALKKAALQS